MTSSATDAQQQHTAALVQLATKHAEVTVPALPQAVRDQLRALGLPVRLFGENLANVRERLRRVLAQRKVLSTGSTSNQQQHGIYDEMEEEDEEVEEVTQYTRASPALLAARESICKVSIAQAFLRLERERVWKAEARKRKYQGVSSAILDELERGTKMATTPTLQGSQYADSRAVSSLVVLPHQTDRVVTASWNATLRIWDTNSLAPTAEPCEGCHEDRIMGLAVNSQLQDPLLCSTSLDRTAKIWKVKTGDSGSSDDPAQQHTISHVTTLRGHAQRLAKAEFHPHLPHLVATTSHDHTWRLWDVNSSSDAELLLQDGHAAAVHGIAWHPDGSLCVTTDTFGIVHAWDVRTAKSVRHWTSAAGIRVVAAHCPHALHLLTGDDAGMLRVHDWRRPQRAVVQIPAHGNVITGLTSSREGNTVATSSFDGTLRLWDTATTYQQLATLEGHDGKVSGVAFCGSSTTQKLVSCGHDKTLKLWC